MPQKEKLSCMTTSQTSMAELVVDIWRARELSIPSQVHPNHLPAFLGRYSRSCFFHHEANHFHGLYLFQEHHLRVHHLKIHCFQVYVLSKTLSSGARIPEDSEAVCDQF